MPVRMLLPEVCTGSAGQTLLDALTSCEVSAEKDVCLCLPSRDPVLLTDDRFADLQTFLRKNDTKVQRLFAEAVSTITGGKQRRHKVFAKMPIFWIYNLAFFSDIRYYLVMPNISRSCTVMPGGYIRISRETYRFKPFSACTCEH